MIEDRLLKVFKEETSGKNYMDGQRVLSLDLVSDMDIKSKDDVIFIDGNVISENLFNEYHTRIEMDAARIGILSTYCTCTDFEQNEHKKRNYCCKHAAAVFYKAVEELKNDPVIKARMGGVDSIIKDNGSVLSMLLGDEREKEEIRIDVYLNREDWSHEIRAELKIGPKAGSSVNSYVLKDINQFLSACYNNIPVEYSKNFTFHLKHQRLDTRDKRLIGFIETLTEMEGKYRLINKDGRKNIDGKYLNIPKFMVREFLEVVRRHRVYLNEGFFSRPVETEILLEEPNIDFDLKYIKDSYVLKSPTGMPASLSPKDDVLLYGTTIYLPDYEFCFNVSPYIEVFSKADVITFPESDEETVLRRLIPALHSLTQNITLSKSIKDKIVMEKVGFSFYFDRSGKDISLVVKVKYGHYEFNIFEDISEKIIYRDTKREKYVISTLSALGFEEIKDRFYLVKEDDYIFSFFKNEISTIQQMGDVYYSENFKGIRHIGAKGIKAEIRPGKYDYFELGFRIGDIPSDEVSSILRAFRDSLKYYKLKSGEYIDLEELELKQLLKLLNMGFTDSLDDDYVKISKSRSAFVENFIEENNIRFLKGEEELKDVSNKLKLIGSCRDMEPEGLNGKLREYQKAGYSWFKTLDYLGFGGILGDEMGLGKTLQAISFILSSKGKRALIIAPTSLIYNWAGEFEKFAPSLSITAANGTRVEREEILKDIAKNDVIITTYNLLKKDIEIYRTLEFDICILDEAQYIKNPSSQNAVSVKEIKARTRFALTGTPIENSLMELWSIFDFIMPGYLYDEKRFSTRYHKRLSEGPEVLEELNSLIKPFILRRRKRNVLSELPDKIEKNLYVALEDEQKKVYAAYNSHVLELIEKKVRDDEFKDSRIEVLSYITKLRQLCLDPSVLMDEYRGSSGKIEALMELLHKSMEEGHRVLVFSQFTSVLKNIGKRIGKEGMSYSYLDGSIPSEKRMELVKSFNDGENPVFLISLKAGGTGLNLTSADVVVHFDPWWNPAVEEQATDRAHRIGQENVVEVIKIIARGTIEEKVLSLQEEKRKLINGLMGDELSSGDSLAAFTEEELLTLFRTH